MRIVYYSGALKDLQTIHSYIARDNAKAADEVVARIRKSVRLLERVPHMGRPGRRGVRFVSVPGLPYVVIHRIRQDTVAIVAVFHTARNRQF